jgi:fermentation-respiration switch protein FrsA (DUF1100 family)
MWFTLELGIGIYAAMIGGIVAFQRHLMYHPAKHILPPAEYGLPSVREVFFPSADGMKLSAWVHAPRAGFPTIVYFHGNAGHLGDRAAKFAAFVDAGFGLVALGYRGYGHSEGSPTEKGIYGDARAAVAYALDTLRVPQGKLIYFGESLGSGVAVQMATERAPGLLMLEAAYTSVEARSAELYYYVLGVRHFVLDKYDSLSKIKNVHAPLLMIHGELDPIIPPEHGRALYAAANDPKQLIMYPQVHHVDFTLEQIVVPLMAAARKYKLIS